MRHSALLVLFASLPLSACGALVKSQVQTVEGEVVEAAPDADDTTYALKKLKSNPGLYTRDNHIYTMDGNVWHGVGANIQDPRGCGACGEVDLATSTQEVKDRVDVLVDEWHATFLRLTLENNGSNSILTDDAYVDSIEQIVNHIASKPGVVVEVSIWNDASLTDMGWPTAQTGQAWDKLVRRIGKYPLVIFGLVNEPKHNEDGRYDAQVWQSLNELARQVRDAENSIGVPQHVIAAQGTGMWSRFLSYYNQHPLTAGGGTNFAYEVHVYDEAGTFAERFETPSQTLPVIIGEFGPAEGMMSMGACETLMHQADALEIPYAGWTFHMRCPPNLLEDSASDACGVGMPLIPTPWGRLLQSHLEELHGQAN